MTWTPVLDAELTRLYRLIGATATAAAMGLTRGAVIGRANRLGLRSPKLAVFADAQANGARKGAIASSVAARERQRRPEAPPRTPAPEPRLPVNLRTACAYIAGHPPFGEHSFCGDPTQPGSPYCAPHHALCYTRVKGPAFVPPGKLTDGRSFR